MWIRTQNGNQLINCDDVFIRPGENCIVHRKQYCEQYEDVKLGNYSSEEKAKEVLNQLQKAIIRGEKVYQMPQDCDVIVKD